MKMIQVFHFPRRPRHLCSIGRLDPNHRPTLPLLSSRLVPGVHRLNLDRSAQGGPPQWNEHGGKHCHEHNSLYNCNPPSGYFNFMALGAAKGGVMVCSSPFNPSATVIYAVTPGFVRTDWVSLDGLATYNYTGSPV